MDIIIADLAYGDSGKGTTVDYLTPATNADILVRYNGGPQAAHYVTTPEGTTHCFSQFGSGTFTPGVRTFLSRFMLVDPLAITAENETLIEHGVADGIERVYIDPRAVVVTPIHRHIGKMREFVRTTRHGSCGMGVGEAALDAKLCKPVLHIGDLSNKQLTTFTLKMILAEKLDVAEQLISEHPNHPELEELYRKLCRPFYVEELADWYWGFAQTHGSHFVENIGDSETTIYEGAQGMLLDVERGFWPYVTKTKTTFCHADTLVGDSPALRVGVVRAYFTRHGPGPFVTEEPELTGFIPDINNGTNPWQGKFRIGWFDLVAARYAKSIAGNQIDYLVVTNCDKAVRLPRIKICTAYRMRKHPGNLADFFELETIRGETLIRAIKTPNQPSVGDQTKLAELLTHCEPVYREFDPPILEGSQKGDYLTYIEKELAIPIGIVSTGPTRKDKVNYVHF